MLGCLRLEKQPDKAFIGCIEKGFDFLGYHFGPEGLSVAGESRRTEARAPSCSVTTSSHSHTAWPGSLLVLIFCLAL